MSLVLDTTISGASSNSYVDLSYADVYWEEHFSAIKALQWAALSDEQKTTALAHACRVVETVKFTDSGSATLCRYDIDQALQFPRAKDTLDDAAFIPEAVSMAQCEQALYLVNFDDSALANRLQGVVSESVGIGKGQVTSRQDYTQTGTSLAPMAVEMLRPFFLSSKQLRRA